MQYDNTDKKSIEAYAKKLLGKTLREYLPKDMLEKVGKGHFGQLLEKYYFGYEPNSDSGADFPEAGVELKSTPIMRGTRGALRSKERLVLNIINYIKIVDERWEDSSFLKKNSLILLIFYFYETGRLNIDQVICMVEMFAFGDYEYDYEMIRRDWEIIVGKIREGKAHELSEGDTMYLGACTKGATSESSLRKQPFSDTMAKQRAFSFKQGYMNSLLDRFKPMGFRYEKLFDADDIKSKTFDEKLKDLFSPYIGKTAFDIGKDIGIAYNGQKSYYHMLSSKILGVSSESDIEEFKKADITMRTIRIKPNGMPKEDISFPAFKFMDVANQEWEDSDLYESLEGKKFFFVIYRITAESIKIFDSMSDEDKNKHLMLEKVVLWNTPSKDIESEAKRTWLRTQEVIRRGVKIDEIDGRFFNDLPSKSQTEMIHVRPHGLNREDTDMLPDGREMTKQCFWFNGNYIAKQIRTID